MDRHIVYPGAIPLDTDLLHIQRHTLRALGALAQAVLGTAPLVDGLECAPGPGLSVVVGPGSLTSLGVLDALPFGSLPADAAPLVQTGLNIGSATVPAGSAPGGTLVRCNLLQARVAEGDDLPAALPYWNAADPSVPWSGPGNTGAAQNTRRTARVQFSVKPGPFASPGEEAPPAPDAGWVPLYGITLRGAAGTVAPGDIRPIPGAPRCFKLPQLSPGFSRVEAFRATGIWTVPAGVRLARVRLVGAGGGGGGGGAEFGGGGGGAGGYAEAIVPLVPGDRLPVEVGAGGGGGVPNVNGRPGGATVFAAGVVAATGGGGGSSLNPFSAGGPPGEGTAGSLRLSGGWGGDGPVVAGVPAGSGGAGAFGGGGRGAFQGGVPADGLAPGSGAGGGYGIGAWGGTGAGGMVLVEY